MDWIATYAVTYAIELLIAISYFNRIFKRKLKTGYVILIGSALYFCAFLLYAIFQKEMINIIDFCIINLLFMLFCYKCNLKNALIQMVLTNVFMSASEVVIIYLISVLFDIPIIFYKSNLSAYILIAMLSKLAYFVILQALSFIITRGKNSSMNSKRYVPLFIFPLLTMITMLVFLLLTIDYEFSDSYKIAVSAISAAYIFACILIFIYYQFLADNEAKLKELESERRFYELNNTYLDVLQHQNEELQMLFHDTKHHYLALSSFDDISKVKEYINKIYPDIENKNTIQISNNKMLDLILNKYIVICKKNNIKFIYEVKTANLDYIDDAELSIILNNALDNAVESAVKSSEKIIELSLRNINNMDMLSVINSCDTPPVHEKGRLLTTKPDSGSHGFGTRIIEKHVKQNNGRFEWFYDEKERRFHLSILFQRK